MLIAKKRADIRYKDPDAVLDYQIDWSHWLNSGDTIATSTWTVQTGITKDSDTKTGATVTIWLSGGTPDERYLLNNRITTVDGRTEDAALIIHVRNTE